MDDSVETSRSSKIQTVCDEQVEGRITSLPDSVLIHIISFLPTEDAVRTVLVPRFRHLWQFLTTLTFDHSKENSLDFVRHVLILHQNATMDKFVLKLGLHFHYSKYVSDSPDYQDFANKKKRMASKVDSWVYFAMRKKVKVLRLDFGSDWDDWVSEPEVDDSYRLPNVVLRSKNLSELKLVYCEIKPSGQIQLNCLKWLCLEEIVLNDEILNQILGGCSVLEELSLIRCYSLYRLGFRNSSVKSLTLFDDPFYEKRVEISCPNIESLDIDGDSEFVGIVDVSSVVVSTTSFSCFANSSRRYKMVKALFKNLGHCKVLKTL